jgi:hypothetical protein
MSNGQGYWDDCGTRTFSHQIPGHVIDITVMSGGGIRTECTCGFYEDVEDWEMTLAVQHAQVHNRDARNSMTPLNRNTRFTVAFPVR